MTATPRTPARAVRPRLRRTVAALAALLVAGAGMAVAAGPTGAAPPVPQPVVPSANGRGDVILNLFQWTWDAVARECTSTIGPAGFGYVQVSPPQEHVTGAQWWTSYQPVSYRIESKLGTRDEFRAMVATCRAAGVGVVADAVLNHTTGADRGSGTGVAGSSFGVDSFPGIYGAADFNDCRSNISNYGDRYQVQNCRLVSLQDLRTGSAYVRDRLAAYLNDLLSLGVAGFRIDAAKHIPAADLAAIKSRLTNPDVFWVHEVIGASGEPVQPSEYLGSGDSHEFFYGRRLKAAFDGNLANLRTIADGLLPSSSAGTFVDNHDTERNGETLSYKRGAEYRLANVFLLAHPYGAPSVYSGYTWDDKDAGAPGASATSVPDASCADSRWVCTQRWTEVQGMVGFHNTVGGAPLVQWTDDGSQLVGFGRGDRGYVALNDHDQPVTRTFQTSMPAGTYCDVVASATCASTVTVSSSGTFTATVPAHGALAIHVGRPGGQPAATTIVYYATTPGWSAYRIHYRVGSGAWTAVPGVEMSTACSGWVSREVSTGGAALTAAFTDGTGTWDNNGGRDYTLTGAAVRVAGGVVTPGSPCGTTPTPTPTPTSTPTSSTAAVSFGVQATTAWGQNVFVVGDAAVLGGWDPARAVPLSSAAYPVWRASVTLPAGSTVQYKYVRKDAAGVVTWESGANRTVTVPSSGTLTLNDTWR